MTDSINAAFFPILIASVIGSPHCAGMCGGFASLYSHNTSQRIMPHLMYSLGRLLTYLILGMVAASLGATLDSLIPIANISALLVGVALIISGLIRLGFARMPILAAVSRFVANCLQVLIRPIIKSKSKLKPFLIGLITTLLPCGWLYSFVALAMASADFWRASMIMFVFWLGTLPMMLSLAAISRVLTSKLGKYQPTLVAVLLIIGGLLSIKVHLQHSNHSHHSHHMHHDSRGHN